MTVKGGVLDILESLEGGKILFAYSGGLHHVQAPGEWLPRPFQDIRIAFEEVDLDQYKSTYGRSREDLLSDLQARLEACESKAN